MVTVRSLGPGPTLKARAWVRPPTLQMPGTRTFDDRKLVHALIHDDATRGQINSLIPGQCAGAQGAVIPAVYDGETLISEETRDVIIDFPANLINWMDDIVDEFGVATRPTTLALHVFAGHKWAY